MQKTDKKKISNCKRFSKLRKSNSLPTIHESSGSISDKSSYYSRLLVSQSLWQALTPNAKRKVKSSLVSKKLRRGLKSSFREELDINSGNKMLMPPLKESPLQHEIQHFSDHNVSCVRPDKKVNKIQIIL